LKKDAETLAHAKSHQRGFVSLPQAG